MRKPAKTAQILGTLAACTSALFLAVSTIHADIVENTESTNWTRELAFGSVTVSNVGGGKVSVTFGGQDPSQPPSFTSVDLVSGGDGSGTPFAGDYVAAGISNIAFKIMAETGTGIIMRVVLNGGYSGLTWSRVVSFPETPGMWVTNIVAVGSTMQGWSDGRSANAVPKASVLWTNDIRNVRYVGVRLTVGDTNAQACIVDSFVLVGPNFASAPAYLVNLGDALEARFGVRTYSALTVAQKALDTDKDGMTDVNEILTGTNPDDRNSIFAAQVVASKAQGITIRWPSVEGGVYTVSRTSDLVAGVFTTIPQGYRLTATSSGYMEFTDTTANSDGGPYFYRVVKE
jgi:hypothetical protein